MNSTLSILGGLLSDINGVSNAYQQSPEDSWLKRLLSNSGSGQTVDGENVLRNYFGYAPTESVPSGVSSSQSPADTGLLRSYFGYSPAVPGPYNGQYIYHGGVGGAGKGTNNTSSSSDDSARQLTSGTGGSTGNNSKRDYSALLAGLWKPTTMQSNIQGAVNIDPSTGLYPMSLKG